MTERSKVYHTHVSVYRVSNTVLGWSVAQDKDKAGVSGTSFVRVRQAVMQTLLL
jgi:hypothetical protein